MRMDAVSLLVIYYPYLHSIWILIFFLTKNGLVHSDTGELLLLFYYYRYVWFPSFWFIVIFIFQSCVGFFKYVFASLIKYLTLYFYSRRHTRLYITGSIEVSRRRRGWRGIWQRMWVTYRYRLSSQFAVVWNNIYL